MAGIVSNIAVFVLCVPICVLAFRKSGGREWRSALFLILVAGLILRMYAASDRCLHPWDERYKSLKDVLVGRNRVVVFNVEHNIEAMFYSGLTIYDFIPDETTIRRLTLNGYRVVINDDGKPGNAFTLMDQVEVLKLVPAEEQ